MTTGPNLVAVLRCHIDRRHDEAEHLLRGLDTHETLMLARTATALLANAIVIIERGDRHGIDEHLAGMGLVIAAQLEVSE